MTTISRPDHQALAEALRRRVLEGPGESDQLIRQATAERAAGGPTMAPPYDDLACQMGEPACRVTDEQVASVLRAMGSEKATFEIIVARGRRRRPPALAASDQGVAGGYRTNFMKSNEAIAF